MKSPYLIEEQETTINVFPANVSKLAEIYTCIPHTMETLIRLQADYPEEVTVVQKDGYVDATVPRSWIKIQPKRKSNMTEEQKRANAERLASYRKAKKEVGDNAAP